MLTTTARTCPNTPASIPDGRPDVSPTEGRPIPIDDARRGDVVRYRDKERRVHHSRYDGRGRYLKTGRAYVVVVGPRGGLLRIPIDLVMWIRRGI